MAHVTQKFMIVEPKKPSVLFKLPKDFKYPMTNGFYLNRKCAEKYLKEDDLDNVKGIKVTVRIIK